MADLHTTLKAKVTAHLELAQAATKDWPSIIGIVEGDPPFVAPDRAVEHIEANDPDHVIRACRADLERLEAHRPIDFTEKDRRKTGVGGTQRVICAAEWGDGDGFVEWFDQCSEIRRIASVYGMEEK